MSDAPLPSREEPRFVEITSKFLMLLTTQRENGHVPNVLVTGLGKLKPGQAKCPARGS
jgi:hypothetical protein